MIRNPSLHCSSSLSDEDDEDSLSDSLSLSESESEESESESDDSELLDLRGIVHVRQILLKRKYIQNGNIPTPLPFLIFGCLLFFSFFLLCLKYLIGRSRSSKQKWNIGLEYSQRQQESDEWVFHLFLNSSGTSTRGFPSAFNLASKPGFSSICVREGRDT